MIERLSISLPADLAHQVRASAASRGLQVSPHVALLLEKGLLRVQREELRQQLASDILEGIDARLALLAGESKSPSLPEQATAAHHGEREALAETAARLVLLADRSGVTSADIQAARAKLGDRADLATIAAIAIALAVSQGLDADSIIKSTAAIRHRYKL